MKKQLKVGGATIQQLPSGTYRVRLDLGKDPITGKRRMTSVAGSTPLEVIEKANVILAGNKAATDKSTLGAAMDEYIRTCELAGHSASTIRGYHVIRRNAFLDLASVRVDMIKPMDIQRSINARAASHSPKTIKNEYGFLHKVLKATAPGLDLSGIVLPSNKNKQDEDEDQVVIQSEQDIINLLADVRHDPDLYLAVLICSQTGLRRG